MDIEVFRVSQLFDLSGPSLVLTKRPLPNQVASRGPFPGPMHCALVLDMFKVLYCVRLPRTKMNAGHVPPELLLPLLHLGGSQAEIAFKDAWKTFSTSSAMSITQF